MFTWSVWGLIAMKGVNHAGFTSFGLSFSNRRPNHNRELCSTLLQHHVILPAAYWDTSQQNVHSSSNTSKLCCYGSHRKVWRLLASTGVALEWATMCLKVLLSCVASSMVLEKHLQEQSIGLAIDQLLTDEEFFHSSHACVSLSKFHRWK